jgi:SAM-dependent methyltransferase
MFTEIFARTGATIVAVDISPDLLQRARARGLPPDRVLFLEKRFEECDVEGPFDAVIGSSVLHHLEVDEALRRIFALLAGRTNELCGAEPAEPPSLRRASNTHLEAMDVAHFLTKPLSSAGVFQRHCDVRASPRLRSHLSIGYHPSTPERLIGMISAVGASWRGCQFSRVLRSVLICCRRPPDILLPGISRSQSN